MDATTVAVDLAKDIFNVALANRAGRGVWRPVELATLAWVDWFNTRRLLEPIGYVQPAEFEAGYCQQTAEKGERDRDFAQRLRLVYEHDRTEKICVLDVGRADRC